MKYYFVFYDYVLPNGENNNGIASVESNKKEIIDDNFIKDLYLGVEKGSTNLIVTNHYEIDKEEKDEFDKTYEKQCTRPKL